MKKISVQKAEAIVSESLQNARLALENLAATQTADLIRLVQVVMDAMQNGNKLMLFGNGGSAADAQHVAAEFVNRFLINRPPLPAIALTTDSSILTSVGNDFSFDDIFAKQIRALAKPGDVALGISTSGNSPNIIKAMEAATELGLRTVILTGGTGGKLKGMAEIVLCVPSSMTPHIQEAHLWVEHLLCRLVDEGLYGTAAAEA